MKYIRLIIFVIIFVLGIMCIKFSDSWGISECIKDGMKHFPIELLNNPIKYDYIKNNYINKYRTIGWILTIFGGVGVLIEIAKRNSSLDSYNN